MQEPSTRLSTFVPHTLIPTLPATSKAAAPGLDTTLLSQAITLYTSKSTRHTRTTPLHTASKIGPGGTTSLSAQLGAFWDGPDATKGEQNPGDRAEASGAKRTASVYTPLGVSLRSSRQQSLATSLIWQHRRQGVASISASSDGGGPLPPLPPASLDAGVISRQSSVTSTASGYADRRGTITCLGNFPVPDAFPTGGAISRGSVGQALGDVLASDVSYRGTGDTQGDAHPSFAPGVSPEGQTWRVPQRTTSYADDPLAAGNSPRGAGNENAYDPLYGGEGVSFSSLSPRGEVGARVSPRADVAPRLSPRHSGLVSPSREARPLLAKRASLAASLSRIRRPTPASTPDDADAYVPADVADLPALAPGAQRASLAASLSWIRRATPASTPDNADTAANAADVADLPHSTLGEVDPYNDPTNLFRTGDVSSGASRLLHSSRTSSFKTQEVTPEGEPQQGLEQSRPSSYGGGGYATSAARLSSSTLRRESLTLPPGDARGDFTPGYDKPDPSPRDGNADSSPRGDAIPILTPRGDPRASYLSPRGGSGGQSKDASPRGTTAAARAALLARASGVGTRSRGSSVFEEGTGRLPRAPGGGLRLDCGGGGLPERRGLLPTSSSFKMKAALLETTRGGSPEMVAAESGGVSES